MVCNKFVKNENTVVNLAKLIRRDNLPSGVTVRPTSKASLSLEELCVERHDRYCNKREDIVTHAHIHNYTELH